MIHTTEAFLKSICIHRAGNKHQEEGIQLSERELELDEEIKEVLMAYFLKPFKIEEYYHFNHESELEMNEVYTHAGRIFADPDCIYEESVKLVKHLYEQSSHPNVKPGEFYVTYIESCYLDGEQLDAIGLFKSESKETFLKVYPTSNGFEVNSDDGININKLDKGCLIINTEKEKGYVVASIDKSNKSGDAVYWMDHFLQLKPREDNYYHTENIIGFTKDFVEKKMPQEYEINRADQVDIMKKSVQFLKEQDSFNLEDFAHECLEQNDLVQSMIEYKEEFEKEQNTKVQEDFDISKSAVKKNAKYMRSIIKLDKNFHIYVHGAKDQIERGYDEASGKNFYKLFFDEES